MGALASYDEVLKGKYPAKTHAKKVAEYIVSKGGDKTGTIYLEGQKQKLLEVCISRGLMEKAGWRGYEDGDVTLI